MPDAATTRSLERNVRLYPWYAAIFNAYFWMPVFFLFFGQHLSLADVLKLEAIYYFGVVLLEVPSGYFSDTVGRKATLLLAAAFLTVAYILFFVGTTFMVLAIAQVFLAAGLAFNSGTDTSFHFDSLAALGRESEFGAREAIASRNSFVAGAGAALAGGAIAAFELHYAYALSALGAIAMLGMVWRFKEPGEVEQEPTTTHGFATQLIDCVRYLRFGSLRWLFLFALCMTVFNHIPYEFYQPYLRLLADEVDVASEAAPLTSGLHMGITMLAASWFAARSIRLRDRIGVGWTLLASMGLQLVIITAMGLVLHPVVAVLVMLRSAPRAMMAAPLNAAIAPMVHRRHRATYLSIQSLAGRLSFSVVLVLLSMLADDGGIVQWQPISRMLTWTAMLGGGAIVLLAITIRALRTVKPIEEIKGD